MGGKIEKRDADTHRIRIVCVGPVDDAFVMAGKLSRFQDEVCGIGIIDGLDRLSPRQ